MAEHCWHMEGDNAIGNPLWRCCYCGHTKATKWERTLDPLDPYHGPHQPRMSSGAQVAVGPDKANCPAEVSGYEAVTT